MRRAVVIGMAVGGTVVAAVAGLAAWSYVERPQVGGTPRQWYRTSAPQVLVPVEHSGSLAHLRARVDGEDVAATVRATGAGLVLELDDVKDGAHRVRVQASPSRIFGDSVDEAFTIHVDTRRPSLALDQAASGWLSASELTGRVEPGSTLAVSYPGGRLVMHPPSGAFDSRPQAA